MNKTRFEEIENKDLHFISTALYDTTCQTAANYGIFFTAERPYELMIMSSVHGTASTSGTVVVEKLTGTTAKGAGIAMGSTISTAGTANTVLYSTLVSTSTASVSDRQLRQGDRLAIKSGGTLTNGKDLCVTVYLKPLGKGDYR